MLLNKAIACDPPRTRRFRLIAPVLVLLCLALLAMVPGILVHIGAGQRDGAEEPSDRFLVFEGR